MTDDPNRILNEIDKATRDLFRSRLRSRQEKLYRQSLIDYLKELDKRLQDLIDETSKAK